MNFRKHLVHFCFRKEIVKHDVVFLCFIVSKCGSGRLQWWFCCAKKNYHGKVEVGSWNDPNCHRVQQSYAGKVSFIMHFPTANSSHKSSL